jgi:M6 family metalloprotease-like protein
MRTHIMGLVLVLIGATGMLATQPPRQPDEAFEEVLETRGIDPRLLTYKRALIPLTNAVMANRMRAAAADADVDAATPDVLLGPTAITGSRSIPVLPVRYSDTSSDPWPVDDLQTELFSEEWPRNCTATATCTGTMKQYYREISYGQFEVTGTVQPWRKLSQKASFYQGSDIVRPDGTKKPCNGLCATGKMGDLIREAIAANPDIRWEDFDNDGPDGIANSDDDNGYVDFVAFVHPERGGECGKGSRAIWSHRSTLSSMTGSDIVTTRTGPHGKIRIDDYVVMPALACDATTMIQIGVFAHEFGHAFGLPDLYDTSSATSGLGNWCLMAAGSWGGDNNSPDRPSHMSPWAKAYLGWISLQRLSANTIASLDAIETTPVALEIPISTTQSYLLSNIRRIGFDSRMYGEGLAVWKINRQVIQAGMAGNTVNALANNHGVMLIEADGSNGLRDPKFRGGPGDLFPGTNNVRTFDNQSTPKSIGVRAICDIGDPTAPMSARVAISTGLCSTPVAKAALVSDPLQPSVVDVADLLNSTTVGTVRLYGRIENLGTNLFKPEGRHLVLRDAEGKTIDVRLPYPLSLPAPPDGTTPSITVAYLIGKDLELLGVVTKQPGGAKTLEVTTASAPPEP